MAAAQQVMISPDDLQQLLQASAAAQQPNMDWNANAELLHQLQQMQQVLTGVSSHLRLSPHCRPWLPQHRKAGLSAVTTQDSHL